MSEAKEKRPVNWQRLGLGLVALLLVCCLVVNVSPIRAEAVEPVTLVLVSAATVIASVMIGIGVMMGQNREAFDQVVQMVQGSNALKDFIQKDEANTDVIPLYRSPGNGGVGSGVLSLLVSGGLIEAIRQVLFEEEVILESTKVPSTFYDDLGRCPYVVYRDYSSYDEVLMFSRLPYVSGENIILPPRESVVYRYYSYNDTLTNRTTTTHSSSSSWFLSSQKNIWVWLNFDLVDEDTGNIIIPMSSELFPLYGFTVLNGLTPGEIASQNQELSVGYSDWASNSEWDVNNSQWWPVAVAPTYDETVTFTQEQVQNGEGTYIIADDPVYNVNLPVFGSVTYERFASAQPLTVSATVTDGGTVSYEWFRYRTSPTLGGTESVGFGSSIVPDTTNTGTWVYYCKATNTISGVSSLPVTSNYCNVTVIDPNDEENPDISPTEAPGVDPDPGGDSDPDANPDVDPDNQTDVENSGNQSVDDLIDVIPDHSEEFGNVLKTLADSMSYEGTEAILTIPQVNFPALGNLVPGFVMMEEQQVNFADYVNMMPDNLLLLVRSLLTCALIMYCFYELYSTVNYALTLKEG